MKKKLILIAVILAVLAIGGKIAYEKGRNYVAKKFIDQMAQTSEVQKYKETIKKELEKKMEKAPEEIPADSKVEPSPTITPEPGGNAGDFWDEPLVKDVYGRFSAGEISTVTSMMADGFTREEKKYIKQLVFSRVSAAEISEIERLYYKYN